MKSTIIPSAIIILYTLMALATSAATPNVLGTDYPCKYISDDPDNDIFCYTQDTITTGDTSYYLINVNSDRRLNISGSTLSASDKIQISSLYDPLGNKATCSGKLPTASTTGVDTEGTAIIDTESLPTIICRIDHPTQGIWLLEVAGTSAPDSGIYSVSANFDIYRAGPHTFDSAVLPNEIKFYKTYIKTGSRQEHLIVRADWADPFANMELTVITPDAKTKSDTSTGDMKVTQAYYMNPGTVAEGTWITQLKGKDARSDLILRSNYEFEYINGQEIIDGAVEEKEVKEYPIMITDSSTPLALTAIRQEAGDTVKIATIYDPNGKTRTCGAYTDGCAIKDPEPGIWLVNIQGQSVVGQAPFRLASTHPTYVPEDYEVKDTIEDRTSIFYYADIYTENKTHLVAVSSWDDYEAKMGMTIISTTLKSSYDTSESDEKVTQKAYLTPGDIAEGRWVIQVSSLWKASEVTTNSNYNITLVPTQGTLTGDLTNGEKKVYYLNIKDTDTPVILSLTSYQSGDQFKISKITGPDKKTTACTAIPSDKGMYTCAIKNPTVGVWTIEVTGTSVIGEGPFSLSSTYDISSCGNSVCDIGENCDTCINDCPCSAGETCHRSECKAPPTTVGEKKTWIQEEYEDGIIAEENYNKAMDELAPYDDTELLSGISTQSSETQQPDESNTENNSGDSGTGTFAYIIFIIFALIPPAYLIYLKKKDPNSTDSYSGLSLDFASMRYHEKVRLLITRPREFFDKMPTTGGYKEPVIFFLLTNTLITATVVVGILILMSNAAIAPYIDMAESFLGISLTGVIITLAIGSLVSGLIGLFIESAILKISFMPLKGKGNYESVLRTFAYLSGMNIALIPLGLATILLMYVSLGFIAIALLAVLIYLIYELYAFIIGYSKTQELSMRNTIIGFILFIILSSLAPGIITMLTLFV